jgi:hypothetical protein
LVDWNTIQIVDVLDNEGRLEVASEEQIYAILGLQKEDEIEKKVKDWRRRPEGVNGSQSKFLDGTWLISQNQPNASLLTGPRSHSYSKTIDPRNWVRRRSGNRERC